jgi:tetratricopeptide (TPR) repeat protein
MFVTFYSYKGGVGRTLALANAAYLLATDRNEPCRVLLWDFDLEAPGLPHLFHCRWGSKKQGFVDLVDTYLGEAKVPPVQDYIHQSGVPGIDLLPAGYIDSKYSGKLERINWRLVYEKAHGFDFLESVRESIKKIEPQYDYVLVDSRTGYSDVGGICLHQLPDLVVLMFRLNSQNLDGTGKVFGAIQRYKARAKKHVDVIPVVSPAWPFATREANGLVKRAKRIFTEERLLDISFDSSLTFGEKLIVREGDDYEIKPRILYDYEGLTRAIRGHNLQDITTIFRLGRQKVRDGRADEAYDYFCRLVQKRRDNQQYWFSWTSSATAKKVRDQEQAKRFLDAFLEEDPKAAYAFLARAKLCRGSADQGIADINRAIQANPSCAQAYWDRALILFASQRYGDALVDFEKYFEISHADAAHVHIGDCLTRLGQFDRAAQQFEMALAKNPRDPDLHRYLARVHLARGQFEAAQSHCLTSLELSPDVRRTETTLAHAMVGLGKRREVESLVRDMLAKSPSDYATVLDCAEVYLALEEPSSAVELLRISKPIMTERESKIRDLLLYVASCLDEEKSEEFLRLRRAQGQPVVGQFDKLNWSLLELRSHFSFPGPSSHISADDRERLLSFLDGLPTTSSPAKN